MIRCFTLAILLTLIMGSHAPGAATQPADAASAEARKAEIQGLIRQLASPDAAVRSDAQAKLTGMGDDAREALQRHLRALAALDAALQGIDARKAIEATAISLDLENAPAERVLAELSKQVGQEIVAIDSSMGPSAAPPRLPSITIRSDQQPFWAVLREACEKGGLTLQPPGYPGDGRLLLRPRAGSGTGNILQHPAHVQGAFLIAISSLSRTNTVELAARPPSVTRSMSMGLLIHAEPKVKIIAAPSTVQLDEVVDERGNSLLGQRTMSSGRPIRYSPYGSATPRPSVWSMHLSLQHPENAGARIARLKGSFKCVIQTRSEVSEVPDALKAAGVALFDGQRKIMLSRLTQSSSGSGTSTTVWLRTERLATGNYDTLEGISMRLVDEQSGRQWHAGNISQRSDGEHSVAFGGHSDSPARGDKLKLVCERTTAEQEVTVPFEFSDLPLP